MSPVFILLSLLVSTINALSVSEVETILTPKINEFRERLYSILESKGIKRDIFYELNGCLEKLEGELNKREVYIRHLKAKIDKIWVTNQPQTIEVPVIVNGNVIVKDSLMAKRIQINVPKNYDISADVLHERLDTAWRKVKEIEDTLENRVVRRDRTRQVIKGTVHFLGPVKANTVYIESIKPSTKINGITLDDLKKNVLRKSGNQRVTGRWTFESGLFVGDLRVNGRLSGINISNVLLTDSPVEQVITGQFKVQHGSFNSLSFQTINGIKRDELVLMSNPLQRITGPKRFTNVTRMDNINLTGRLNGYNWARLIRNSINIDNPSPIISRLKFDTVPLIKNLQVRSVNNIVLENLDQGLIPEELSHLSGPKVFRSLSASKITLSGKLNNLQVPRDLVTLKSLHNSSGTVIFDGNVSFASNLTVGAINDVAIARDVVLSSTTVPQVIHGNIIFDRDIKASNIVANQTRLRHINLNDVESMIDDQSIAKRSNVVYEGKLVINGSLTVDKINGVQIDQLIDSLFLRSKNQKISWPTRFDGLLSIDSVNATKINGLSIPGDLVLKDTGGVEQVITGRKTFEHIVLGPGDLKMKGNTLNGYQLNELENKIIKNDRNARKECYGKKVFSSIDVMGNIIAERVNGLNIESDVMLADRHQTITGKLHFGGNITVNQISFDSLNLSRVNNLSVDNLLDRLVMHDQPIVTLENKYFRGGLEADEVILNGTINGYKLADLRSEVFTLDTPQAIHSPLRFEDEVTFNDHIDTRSVNGYDLQQYFTNLMKTGYSKANNKLIINGDVTVAGNVFAGRLQNHNASVLKEFIYQPTLDNQFSRPVIFNSTVEIDYLTVDNSASLDGIHPDDLIGLDQTVELDGPLTVKGNVHIESQLIVKSGKINNCSLAPFFMASQSGNFSSYNPINLSEVNILGNLRLINATINNVDIASLKRQVIKVSDPQNFDSTITFDDDVYVNELYISGPINGIDLNAIYKDSVKKSFPSQKITGRKVFKSLQIRNGDVTFNGNAFVAGLVNGVNLTKLNNDLITPSGSHHVISGRKTFISNQPIILTHVETPFLGQVNLSDIALVYTNESIPYDAYFTQPVTVDNIKTRALNSRNIGDIQNTVVFADPISVQKLTVKRINGVPVAEFASKDALSKFKGNYTLNGKVYVRGHLNMNLSSHINGVDPVCISNRSISLRSNGTIPGRLVFNDTVKFTRGIMISSGNDQPSSLVNKLKYDLENINKSIEEELHKVEISLYQQNRLLSRLTEVVGKPRLKYLYFDHVDDFNGFDIDTDHIDKVSVSQDFRLGVTPELQSSMMQSNQWFGRSIYFWFADRVDQCSRKTFSFDILGPKRLTEVLSNTNGKTFPPMIFTVNNTLVSISAWTSSSFYGCPKTSHLIFDYPIQSSANDSSRISPHKNIRDLIEIPSFSDIKYFTDSQKIYAVTLDPYDISYESKSTVYVYRCTPRVYIKPSSCLEIGTIDTFKAISMEIFYSHVHNTILLAILENPSNCEIEPKISYYAWNPNKQRFITHGSLTSPNPVGMMFTEVAQSSKVYFLVANNLETGVCAKHKQRKYNSSSMVNIFTLSFAESSPIQVELVQAIPLNPISMSYFVLGPEVYLVIASKTSSKIYIYQYQETNGFAAIQEQENEDGENVVTFWFSSNDLLLITTTTNNRKASIYKAMISGLANF